MADLSTTRNYADGEVLVRADLDAFLDDIETFINVTGINDDNIQNSGITGSLKLLNQSVTEAKLATNSVSTLKIQAGAVTNAQIAAGTILTSNIAPNNITTALIADQNVTTAKIADAAVTTAKLATNAVTDTILSNDPTDDTKRAVSTNSIHDAAVTTPKIADGSITPAKLATNYATLTMNGGVTSVYDFTSITTSGRPVMLLLYTGQIINQPNDVTLQLLRNDGVSDTNLGTIYTYQIDSATNYGAYFYYHGTNGNGNTEYCHGAPVIFVDTPAAGTYTYKISGSTSTGGTFSGAQAIIYEL
jgi:hypothetical protein